MVAVVTGSPFRGLFAVRLRRLVTEQQRRAQRVLLYSIIYILAIVIQWYCAPYAVVLSPPRRPIIAVGDYSQQLRRHRTPPVQTPPTGARTKTTAAGGPVENRSVPPYPARRFVTTSATSCV